MKKMAFNALAAVLSFCFLAFSQLVFSQTTSATGTCRFQTLSAPKLVSFAEGINDAGAVVGGMNTGGPKDNDSAFLFFRGKFTAFLFPGLIATDALNINNHSQIVGTYTDKAQRLHGFVVHSGGFHSIDVPGAANGTFANGINNLGDIVGTFVDATGHGHGFLLHNGRFTTFLFPRSAATFANGINDHAEIVGSYIFGDVNGVSHGFMVRNGAFLTIDFPGAVNTKLAGVNNVGEIVGSYSGTDQVPHGFALADGTFITIDDPGAIETFIGGVNNLEQIVGSFTTPISFANLSFEANCKNIF